jgi:hypothetical protein
MTDKPEKIVAVCKAHEDGTVELLFEMPEDECPPELLAELRARGREPNATGLLGNYRRVAGRLFKRIMDA